MNEIFHLLHPIVDEVVRKKNCVVSYTCVYNRALMWL